MTDLELMEMAAKAAGIEVHRGDGWQSEMLFRTLPRPNSPLVTNIHWNPLADDGDALRLAVDLGVRETLVLIVGRSGVHCEYQHPYATALASVSHDGDPCAATRRAIVRAAAGIGRDVP